MSKEIAIKESKILAETDEDRFNLVKNTYCKDLTNTEMVLFWNHAKSVGLDPLKKQVYAIKRAGKVTFQTGIDGLRSIAARSGAHAGTDETECEYSENRLYKAKCTVWKIVQGTRVSFVGTAKWSEFYPGEKMGHMWRKMPEVMLGKVAESIALRKAFPEDIGELYIDEEMERNVVNAVPILSGNKEKPQRLAQAISASPVTEPIDAFLGEKEAQEVKDEPAKKKITNHAPGSDDVPI